MFNFFVKNGEVVPIKEAVIPLQNIEYSYGFGVYETIRVSKGNIYFLDDHLERLLNSTSILNIEHSYTQEQIKESIQALVSKLSEETYNLKVQLIGAPKIENVLLTIYPTNPLFPDRKLYNRGVAVKTAKYERLYPNAKSLNMLGSYLAYRDAQRSGCYEALLISKDEKITEGTRSNFFFLKDDILYTSKAIDVLEGMTRKVVMLIAEKSGIAVVERDIFKKELSGFDSVFLTNTSSKIMPVSSIDDIHYEKDEIVQVLISTFNESLKKSKGNMEDL